ncbi:undecaprenyl-diphosphate phosphatase [bacterium]|nr:undecaprenyl-diphosphate phosphatase [bacterium]
MNLISILKSVLLGILEGITEFLPVSSTGHLILAGKALNFESLSGTFEISIQLGAIIAVLFLYKDFFVNQFKPSNWLSDGNKKMVVAVIPFLLIGFFCYSFIKSMFSETIVLFSLIFGGICMICTDAFVKNKEVKTSSFEEISYKQAFYIGLFQCFAFIPGMSRSGSTIVGGVLLGLNYKVATKFSFLLSVPVMFCAVSYELLKSFGSLTVSDLGLMGIAIVVSFFSGLVSMVFLIKMIEKWKLVPFGIYRIVLGIIGLFIIFN